MTFAIITHVPHGIEKSGYFAYAPYVREMDLWMKYADHTLIVAPLELMERTAIHTFYGSAAVDFMKIPGFDILNFRSKIKALFAIPGIFRTIITVMRKADHIHLRCPGNIGLIGCVAQIFFPSKPKTAKYAGNWDPKAPQPLSYRLQKWILSNTFLTRNINVLVYGQWRGSTKNIKPFFTATYSKSEINDTLPRDPEIPIRFVFAGSLSDGKRPDYAIALVEAVHNSGHKATLSVFGSGKEADSLQQYIDSRGLSNIILEGTRTKDEMKSAYQNSHFLLLPSKSEGWPKVVAEAMFWGCVPLATDVSCVAHMLAGGNRGVLLTLDPVQDAGAINALVENASQYRSMSVAGMEWSRQYTTDFFESEIKSLL